MNWYKESQVTVEKIPSYEKAIVILSKQIAGLDPDQFRDDEYYRAVKEPIDLLMSNLKKIDDKGNGHISSEGCDKKIIIEARRLLGGMVAPQSHTVFNKLVVLNETVRNCV
jgi:hypothetical protein